MTDQYKITRQFHKKKRRKPSTAFKKRKRNSRRYRKRVTEQNQLHGKHIIAQIYATIIQLFPELFEWMREIEDFREASDYDLAEIITASLAMFLFKTGSRNEFNNLSTDGNFQKNYEKLFGFKMPHLDTVYNIMKRLEEKHLEKLKRRMIKELLDRKCLYKYRFSKQYIVAVDGTGVASFGHKHCDQCLHLDFGHLGYSSKPIK
ncbi:hypothetical protein TI05_07365 [Achromatium sp. WMS3]|nr:hypothetical protein TI05_07365 [Achromatium sp. WMS3]